MNAQYNTSEHTTNTRQVGRTTSWGYESTKLI